MAADDWTEPWPGWTDAVTAAPKLALEPDIIRRLGADLADTGLIGEQDTAAIIMLAMVSLVFERQHIVSVAIKGQSSSGKSNAMDRVLEMWTEARPGGSGGEYIRFGSVSPKALVYDKRSFRHRMIVMEEAIGLSRREDDVAYQLRIMLSQGYFEHLVTDGTEGVKTAERGTESIRKEGPSGFLVSTTLLKLEEELETRLVSVYTDESEQQTARIIRATAAAAGIRSLSASTRLSDEWPKLTRWLRDTASRDVVLDEECEELAAKLSSRLVRGRRDVGKVIGLIKAHAMLHQVYRAQEQGHVVADIRDYQATARLLKPVLDREHQASVPDHVRKVVEAVEAATMSDRFGAVEYPSGRKVAEVAEEAWPSVRRWLIEAQQMGYVRDLSPGPGKPSQWTTDAPLPEEQAAVLPHVPAEPPKPWQPGWRFTVRKLKTPSEPPAREPVNQCRSEAVSSLTSDEPAGTSGAESPATRGGFGGYSVAAGADIGPRKCTRCGQPLDPVLVQLGYPTHGETEEA